MSFEQICNTLKKYTFKKGEEEKEGFLASTIAL
jgi:hypothetical protein